MIDFVKKNGYDILKMIVNQIALAVLGIIMTSATYENDKLFFITSVCCTVVYLYVLYIMVYDIGSKDKPAIDGKRAELKPWRGFWISFCANLPNMILAVVAVVAFLFMEFQQPVTVYDKAGDELQVYIQTDATEGEEKYDRISLFSDNGAKAYTDEEGHEYESQIKNALGKPVLVYEKNEEGKYEEVILYTDIGDSLYISTSGEPRAISGQTSETLYGISNAVLKLSQSTYAGMNSILFSASHYTFLVTPLFPMLFCGIAYYFGATGRRILFFLPERKQKPPKYR
ncbi:MAG: hypothetical protein E7591_08415 [Ruminococcaceae bacterium]|nr:hypothetical protein [Oscillospiraceae bacterium]